MQGWKVFLISHISMLDGVQLCIKFSVATVKLVRDYDKMWQCETKNEKEWQRLTKINKESQRVTDDKEWHTLTSRSHGHDQPPFVPSKKKLNKKKWTIEMQLFVELPHFRRCGCFCCCCCCFCRRRRFPQTISSYSSRPSLSAPNTATLLDPLRTPYPVSAITPPSDNIFTKKRFSMNAPFPKPHPSLFLDAPSHLYRRVCPSVRP